MADKHVLHAVNRMLDHMDTNRFIASGFQPTVASTTPKTTNEQITNPHMLSFIQWFNMFHKRYYHIEYTFSSTTDPNTFALEREHIHGMIPFTQIWYYITVQTNGELCIKDELNNREFARGTVNAINYLIHANICMALPRITHTPITDQRIIPLLEWFNAFLISDSRNVFTLDNTTDPNTFSLSHEISRLTRVEKTTWGYITVTRRGDLLMTDESYLRELARGIDAIKQYLITQHICKQ
jgi:hypothetical protein